jgi:hypothetical protein
MAKVTNTGGRNGLNKIDKLAKVTNTGGRKPKELNKIDKLAKPFLLDHCGSTPSTRSLLARYIVLYYTVKPVPYGHRKSDLIRQVTS